MDQGVDQGDEAGADRSRHPGGSAAIHRFPRGVAPGARDPAPKASPVVSFDRLELREILTLYGRHVAEGDWRDYAIGFTAEKATFSIYRRASEVPLYRIEKDPSLAQRQGAYAVIASSGLILKRGRELARVISVLDRKPKLEVV